MIPFIPESIENMKTRYPLAIKKLWNLSVVVEDRPGNRRENVFDCEDGIRLIISRDITHGIVTIHFSCSVNEGVFVGRADKSLLKKFAERFKEISGRKEECTPAFFSQKGIPHFLIFLNQN